MPKPLKYPIKLLIGVNDELLKAIDKWRRDNKDLPTRSEAIRRLTEAALAKARAKPKADLPAASPAAAAYAEQAAAEQINHAVGIPGIGFPQNFSVAQDMLDSRAFRDWSGDRFDAPPQPIDRIAWRPSPR
jgi:hypothetical protein